MSTQNKIYIFIGYTLLVFASGRYTIPEKVVTKTVTVEVEKKSDDMDVDTKNDTHNQVTTITDVKPDGEKITTTTTTHDISSDVNKDDKKITDNNKSDENMKETTHASDKITLSAIGGLDLRTFQPIYGASLTKPVLGPLTLGLFGLSNGSCGLSVGVTF